MQSEKDTHAEIEKTVHLQETTCTTDQNTIADLNLPLKMIQKVQADATTSVFTLNSQLSTSCAFIEMLETALQSEKVT